MHVSDRRRRAGEICNKGVRWPNQRVLAVGFQTNSQIKGKLPKVSKGQGRKSTPTVTIMAGRHGGRVGSTQMGTQPVQVCGKGAGHVVIKWVRCTRQVHNKYKVQG